MLYVCVAVSCERNRGFHGSPQSLATKHKSTGWFCQCSLLSSENIVWHLRLRNITRYLGARTLFSFNGQNPSLAIRRIFMSACAFESAYSKFSDSSNNLTGQGLALKPRQLSICIRIRSDRKLCSLDKRHNTTHAVYS